MHIGVCNSVVAYIISLIYKELRMEAEGGNNKWPWKSKFEYK